MTHSPSLFALKLVVISLGLVLIGAIIFTLTTIMHQAKADKLALECHDLTVHLNNHGTLSNVTPEGKMLQFTITTGTETKVVTADRCTGTILQTVTIVP